MTYDKPFLIYGATGYTGDLTARLAVDLGMRPTLAGRNREKVERLATELGLPFLAFALDDGIALRAALHRAARSPARRARRPPLRGSLLAHLSAHGRGLSPDRHALSRHNGRNDRAGGAA